MAKAAVRRGTAPSRRPAGNALHHPLIVRLGGGVEAVFGLVLTLAFASYNAADPSFNSSAPGAPMNFMGRMGASLADAGMQSLGLSAWMLAVLLILGGVVQASGQKPQPRSGGKVVWMSAAALLMLSAALAAPAPPATWPLAKGLGGFWGEALLSALGRVVGVVGLPGSRWIAAILYATGALTAFGFLFGLKWRDVLEAVAWLAEALRPRARTAAPQPRQASRATVKRARQPAPTAADLDGAPAQPFRAPAEAPAPQVMNAKPSKTSKREDRESQPTFAFVANPGFRLPELNMLTKPKARAPAHRGPRRGPAGSGRGGP